MAAEQHFCERHHRPAVASRVRVLPEGTRETEYLRAQQIEVEFSDDAVELLAREGFDREFGALPLRRAIQRMVEHELSRLVLGGKANAGERVYVEALEDELHFDVERDGVAESRKEAAQPEAVGS